MGSKPGHAPALVKTQNEFGSGESGLRSVQVEGEFGIKFASEIIIRIDGRARDALASSSQAEPAERDWREA